MDTIPCRVYAYLQGPGSLIVSDRRQHRGPHPDDRRLFAEERRADLKSATEDLSILLSKDYALLSALKLVGDRYALTQRQRLAVRRSACSDQQMVSRRGRMLPAERLRGTNLAIDGFNLLTTIEAALSGGVLLLGRDGCLRDLASMHGSYRRVQETPAALELIGALIESLNVTQVLWYLDRPVSNSGRLRTLLEQLAQQHHWPWEVQLVADPDLPLKATQDVVVSADAAILDTCPRWFNGALAVVERSIPNAWIIDF